jgi:hypothetical protein
MDSSLRARRVRTQATYTKPVAGKQQKGAKKDNKWSASRFK